jgi:hypothetical protein
LVYISPLKPNGSNGVVIEDRSQGLELTEQELFEVPGASREKEIKHMSLGLRCAMKKYSNMGKNGVGDGLNGFKYDLNG